VIASNPASHKGFRDLGELYLARFEQTRDPRDASAAADAFAQAVERYPTNSALVAQLAVAHKQAGSNPAATLFSQKALWLDAVNRAQGHVDKYLPAKMLQLLQEISEAELTTALPSLE